MNNLRKTGYIIMFLSLVAVCQAQSGSRRDMGRTAASFFFHISAATDSTITSAGIYDQNNILIKTLWAQRYYKPGTHTEAWDGTDDFGKAVPSGSYHWQVLSNNVQYIWQGIIGNTSENKTGTGIYNGLDPITCMCFAKGRCYFGTSYNEQMTTTFRFDTNHPQTRTSIDDITSGNTPYINDNATDGTNVYWAGNAFNPVTNQFTEQFVYATRVKDDSLVTFAGGQTIPIRYGHSYPVIGYLQDVNGSISSITVQQEGNYLFLARPKLSTLSVITKTGAFVRNIIVPRVSYARIDPTDKFIWLTHDSMVTEKYAISRNGTLTSTGITIRSEQPIVALSVSAKLLLIGEGGMGQQIRAYNPATGKYLWTYGKPGGYLTNATVSNDKFYWNDARKTYCTFISFTPEGTFWVGDIGNFRYQHYTASHSFIERIMFIGRFYNVNVDANNPSRVFANSLEFKVGYTKPLLPGNGSWTLVKNWGGSITPAQWSQYVGMKCVNTFPNGKTYCLLKKDNANYEVIELTSADTLRHTGTVLMSTQYLSADLNLYRQSTVIKGNNVTWHKSIFSNTYNAGNAPVWRPEQQVGSIYADSVNIPVNKTIALGTAQYRPDAITADGVIVGFDYSRNNPGYHLSGIKNSRYIFKTALSVNHPVRYTLFPKGHQFETGNGVGNAGSTTVILDKSIIWGYYGEGWRGGQTNMYTHLYENGLVINQFGTAVLLRYNSDRGKYAYAGDAANAFYLQLIKLRDGSIYLYHNDESLHGGIHRWKITGMNTIKIETGFLK